MFHELVGDITRNVGKMNSIKEFWISFRPIKCGVVDVFGNLHNISYKTLYRNIPLKIFPCFGEFLKERRDLIKQRRVFSGLLDAAVTVKASHFTKGIPIQ